MKATPSDIARWLVERDDILIATHLNPDGDALGSSIALCLALKKLGKRACVVNQDAVPSYLNMLPGQAFVYRPGSLPFRPQAALLVDCALFSRLGRAEACLDKSLPLACVDHHLTKDSPASPALIEPEAAASGELVRRVIAGMGLEIDGDMALCLYVAIATDTGNFSFDNTRPETFSLASECLGAGFDLAQVNFALFRQRSHQRTMLLGRAITSLELSLGGRLAAMRLYHTDFAECGADRADTEGAVNFAIDVEGVKIAFLAQETEDGVKFSLRSRGDVDVAALAAELGGGGHAKAAGLTLKMSMDDAVRAVADKAREALK